MLINTLLLTFVCETLCLYFTSKLIHIILHTLLKTHMKTFYISKMKIKVVETFQVFICLLGTGTLVSL